MRTSLNSFVKILAAVGTTTVLLTNCQLPAELTQRFIRATTPAQTDQSTTVRRAEAAMGSRTLFPASAAFNVRGYASLVDDSARLLAGLPASGRDHFSEVRQSRPWQSHQASLDKMWKEFEVRHERPIRSWAPGHIGDLRSSSSLFYPFSGPDFLFAQAFFPHSDTVVLCGLEPCEPLPPLQHLSADEMVGGLDGLVTSINTAMQFSFFITKDMRRDLVSTRFRGVLPVILTFMARSGHAVESIDLVKLDANGQPVLVSGTGGSAPGAMIRARAPGGGLKRVLYFRQDLSDSGLSPGAPFLKFVSSLGRPPVFLKSASYLMHESGFANIRNYLLTNSRGIVQCPSGVPYRDLLAKGWKVDLYGNYRGTLDMFGTHQQPDLISAYQQGQGQALDFGIGYMFQPERTCLMVARPGSGRLSQR
ncbi:MAG: hypothetical protein ACOYOF_21990 [Verrucomicrobiaceae bacterium]